MYRIAQSGVTVEEFRDLAGPAVDMLQGNTSLEEDMVVLLDFYYEQAARARVLMAFAARAALVHTSYNSLR